MENLGQLLRQTLEEELNKEADKIIDQLVKDMKNELKQKATAQIGRVVTSIMYHEELNPVSMETNVTIQIKNGY